jgi:hypothetical protein
MHIIVCLQDSALGDVTKLLTSTNAAPHLKSAYELRNPGHAYQRIRMSRLSEIRTVIRCLNPAAVKVPVAFAALRNAAIEEVGSSAGGSSVRGADQRQHRVGP